MAKRELTAADILPVDDYAKDRREYRRRIGALKRDRRVAVGPVLHRLLRVLRDDVAAGARDALHRARRRSAARRGARRLQSAHTARERARRHGHVRDRGPGAARDRAQATGRRRAPHVSLARQRAHRRPCRSDAREHLARGQGLGGAVPPLPLHRVAESALQGARRASPGRHRPRQLRSPGRDAGAGARGARGGLWRRRVAWASVPPSRRALRALPRIAHR